MEMPQIVIVVLVTISLIANLLKNGESKQYNFFTALIDNSIVLGVLYWGGFFN